MHPSNIKFMAIAPDVYGRFWKTDICRHLGFDYKTVRNWINGVHETPRSLLVLLEVYERMRWQYVRGENVVRKVRADVGSR